MARISLLFSLAFALALGSLFLSVSGHAPPAPPRKPLCPKTVSELQTLPFTEITEILIRKERFAPKTAEFKAMFTMCEGYIAYLESLYKFENPIVDVLGIAKAKYALMTRAILAARASVSGKVDKKTYVKLRKSCAGLTKGFLQIQKTIVKISAKHDFKADAKINSHESKNIGDAMINFKNSINAFMDVVKDLEKKKMKKVGRHARALQEDGRVRNAFERWMKEFSDKYGGYLGGKTHGRELTEADFNANSHAGADVKGFETIYEKFSHYFDGYLGSDHPHGRQLTGVNAGGKVNGSDHSTLDKFTMFFGSFLSGKAHGRELTEAHTGINAGAQTGLNVNGRFEKFSHFFGSFLRGEAHGRKLLEANAGVNARAQAGGKVNGMFEKFSHFFGSFLRGEAHGRKLLEANAGVNAGGNVKVQIDGAGKMKVAGGDGFKSLNRAHKKHFVSTEA